MIYVIQYILLIPFFIGMSSGFVKDSFHIQKQSQPLEIGSFNNNWESTLTNDFSSGIDYGIANDDQYLYVYMQIRDEQQVMMAIHDGILFNVKTKGKKGISWGLKFPFPSNIKEFTGANTIDNHQMVDSEFHKEFKPQKKEVSLFNNHFLTGMSLMEIFDNKEDVPYVVHNRPENGPEAILKLDTTGLLCYESKIPLEDIFPNPEKFLVADGNRFSFEILLEAKHPQGIDGGRPPQEMRGQGQPPSGGSGEGMRGGGGGQRPSGGGERQDKNHNSSIQTVKISVKKAYLANY